jgi:hypothetical protein
VYAHTTITSWFIENQIAWCTVSFCSRVILQEQSKIFIVKCSIIKVLKVFINSVTAQQQTSYLLHKIKQNCTVSDIIIITVIKDNIYCSDNLWNISTSVNKEIIFFLNVTHCNSGAHPEFFIESGVTLKLHVLYVWF